MLAATVKRAQVELTAHRIWLRAFTSHATTRPRLTTPTATVATPTRFPLNCRHFTIRRGGKSTQGAGPDNGTRKRNVQPRKQVDEVALDTFSSTIQNEDYEGMIKIYETSTISKTLRPNDVRGMVQLLHFTVRQQRQIPSEKRRPEILKKVVGFAERLVKDTRSGDLVPHGPAYIQLLALFKESDNHEEGVKFWKWLQKQDDRFVTPAVYGVAIELLAVQGSPLADLEDLYQEALARFPGNFLAYHLSPDAIVPERDQEIRIKGIPMSLLQGILTARLIRGDTRNAYLLLDTALRLHPILVPSRFFSLFLEERPIVEAFTVFAMACRAGIAMPTSHFRPLLSTLRNSSDLKEPSKHIATLRAMLSISYLYAGAGGVLTKNMLNEMLIAITQIMRVRGMENLEPKQRRQVTDSVMGILRKTLEGFASYGVTPAMSAFNSIITNVGGWGQSKETIGIALRDAVTLGLEPSLVTMRSVLTAAGKLADRDLVRNAWKSLVEFRTGAGEQPPATDLHIMVKACILSSQPDCALSIIEEHKSHLHEMEVSNLMERLENFEEEIQVKDPAQLDLDQLLAGVQKIHRDLESMEKRSQSKAKFQDFFANTLPVTLLPTPPELRMPESEMRAFYDLLTTEQVLEVSVPSADESTSEEPTSSAPLADELSTVSSEENTEPSSPVLPSEPASPALSSTSIPFGELRYWNWTAINHLLYLAEKHDKSYQEAVDAAIAQGVRPPSREKGLESLSGGESMGLSDLLTDSMSETEESRVDLDAVKQRILELRGRAS